MVVQKIIELAPINFVHRNGNSKVPFVILEVSDATFEQIVNS